MVDRAIVLAQPEGLTRARVLDVSLRSAVERVAKALGLRARCLEDRRVVAGEQHGPLAVAADGGVDIEALSDLTGHLVFSTLHTNDAPSAFVRLVDIGVKPFLVASGVRAVLGQRLVRTNCTTCKAPYVPEEIERELYESISPVNTFRITLNHLLGTEYEPLPDKSYFSRWSQPYVYTEVPGY